MSQCETFITSNGKTYRCKIKTPHEGGCVIDIPNPVKNELDVLRAALAAEVAKLREKARMNRPSATPAIAEAFEECADVISRIIGGKL
jgi:hypothetical protein